MRIIVAVFALLGALASFVTAQALQFRAADEKLQSEAQEILSLAVKIATQSYETLNAINQLSTTPCSAADLKELRYLLHHTQYLQDLGRSTEDKILCTAVWGELTKPIQLPKPVWKNERQTSFWVHIRGAPDERVASDILMAKGAISFTDSKLFQHLATTNENLWISLISSNGDHVFQSFGSGTPDIGPSLNQSTAFFSFTGRYAHVCAATIRMCALVQNKESENLAWKHPLASFSLIIFGALAGAGSGRIVSQRSSANRTLEKKIIRALDKELIEIAYQPIVHLGDGMIAGVEVLTR
jgi:sensor c-di-GMP phosphodiesterase-like protein